MSIHPTIARAIAPWKPSPQARTCRYCGSQRPGMQPLKLWRGGKMERGYWHLECFAKDRNRELKK